jgi:hypothetical protein
MEDVLTRRAERGDIGFSVRRVQRLFESEGKSLERAGAARRGVEQAIKKTNADRAAERPERRTPVRPIAVDVQRRMRSMQALLGMLTNKTDGVEAFREPIVPNRVPKLNEAILRMSDRDVARLAALYSRAGTGNGNVGGPNNGRGAAVFEQIGRGLSERGMQVVFKGRSTANITVNNITNNNVTNPPANTASESGKNRGRDDDRYHERGPMHTARKVYQATRNILKPYDR